MYRIGVTFLTPAGLPPVPATPPTRIGLSTGPTALPFARAGALTATASEVNFTPLNPQPTDTLVHHYSPAIEIPNASFSVFGSGLDQPTAARLYLLERLSAVIQSGYYRFQSPSYRGSICWLLHRVGRAGGVLFQSPSYRGSICWEYCSARMLAA